MAENISVGYGLVTVACKKDPARITPPEPVNLCIGQPGKPAHEASPRKMPSHCDVCGPMTDLSVMVKGIKSGSTFVLIDGEAAAAAKESYGSEYKKQINLVPHLAADFLAQTGEGDTMHYITPADASAADHYALLVQLIGSHPELAFVGLHTPRTSTGLYHVTVRDGVLVMTKRTRTEGMKAIPSVGGTVNEKFLSMLEGTLEEFIEPFDPEAYEDRYAATLAGLIDTGTVIVTDKTTKAPTAPMTDDELMEKLAALKSAKKPAKKKAKAA